MGPDTLGRPPQLESVPKTKIVTRGTEATVNAFYKKARIKQFLKKHALRQRVPPPPPHSRAEWVIRRR